MAYTPILFQDGDLVSYMADLQPRVYRVVGQPEFEYNDWWYRFHHTAQGSMAKTEPKLPQAQLIRVNYNGDIWGS
jgi:hypothetical protein